MPLVATDRIAIIGLLLGSVFGMAGTFVSQAGLRQILWAIDGAGLVAATAILALKFWRKGNECVAAGFLVFAIAESHLVTGAAAGLEAGVPSFAAGTGLWATALLLISLPREFPTWVRASGLVASILFVVTSGRIFWGEPLLATTSPLPFFAYPFLVLTFVGWIWSLVQSSRAGVKPANQT